MAEQIVKTEYSDVMQKSYIDYAMSVITQRALPDARDGLKPVQRRVLYAMDQLGLDYDKPHRKSARIVGDTMGKYHPHGDSSIYETLVVLAQDFKKGKKLVDGHGNFGSIEGDGAAAMRYTEARLDKFTQEVYLDDLDKDVVDFVPNFDETEKEPAVLPVKVPNLLVNGAEGIAVGMTTNIPPHNLGEVVDAMIMYIDNEKVSVEDLMEAIPGPDFPTGGIVANKSELLSIYESGSGKIKLRGKLEFEKGKSRERDRLVVTEIPYTMIGAGISKFIADVIDLVESKKTNDIVDISNASDKNGIRIILELKKGADIELLTNMLYKKTKLEDTFGVNMLAIADQRPEVMSLRDIIKYNVDFQYELSQRKYKTLLERALDQKEVKEGLIRAINVIDLIIEIIRGCQNRKQVKECLVNGVTDGINFQNPESEILASNLSFTPRQADAILELRLSKLIGLEILALEKEYREITENIAFYEDVLSNRSSMKKVIKKELKRIKSEFSGERKTTIEEAKEAVFDENAFVEQEYVFVQDRLGYAKLLEPSVFDRNVESVTNENKYIFRCMNTDSICIFTDNGNMHRIKVIDIPQKKAKEKGQPIDNLGNYSSAGESIVALYSLSDITSHKLYFATKQGMVKIVDGSEFETNRKTMACTKLADGDELIGVSLLNISSGADDLAEADDEEMPVAISGGFDDGEDGDIGMIITESDEGQLTFDEEEDDNPIMKSRAFALLQTEEGYFLKFYVRETPELKKATKGVRGIKLSADDFVKKLIILEAGDNKMLEYNDRVVDLRKIKTLKRGAKGTKLRKN